MRGPQGDVDRLGGGADGENVVTIEQMPTAQGEVVALIAKFGKEHTGTVTHEEAFLWELPWKFDPRAETKVVEDIKFPFVEIGSVTPMAFGDI